jgi:hypothetical protein
MSAILKQIRFSIQDSTAVVALLFLMIPGTGLAQVPTIPDWEVHDLERPQPEWVDTGAGSDKPVPPPSDAIVLFDGKDLSAWQAQGGGAAKWTIKDGYMEIAPGTGAIRTKEGFGDVQLHVEWASPMQPNRTGQDKGNSGIFLMDTYEVQVLNSYESKTYPDGQASAVYGQYPPLVNASRPSLHWQVYDIIFRRPHFDNNGNVTKPATVTVLHNGVLVQDHVALTGPTGHHARPPYEAHADELPLQLQDHNEPVRYRNIWVRKLTEGAAYKKM